MKICIIGSVPKGDKIRESWSDWKLEYNEVLRKISGVEIVDGDQWQDEARPFTTVGHDAYIIKMSDVVIVNAQQKLGAGTAMEMVIAKYFSKPLITVLPRDSHHRRSNVVFENKVIEDWVHPFVLTISDSIIESINEAPGWIQRLSSGKIAIKDIGIIDEAIQEYLKLVEKI